MKIAMGVEYDGSAYYGFQFQENLPTVQQALESALSRVANHSIRVICSGRTDTGVHAVEQVIHFESNAQRSTRAWLLGANANLPRDISIRWVCEMPSDFHARFSAISRSYYYLIYNNEVRSALLRNKAYWYCRPLNTEFMQKAAHYLFGTHDFTSFRSSGCQAKKTVRTITDLSVFRKNEFVICHIQSDGFLHHMVRNIVGTLLPVGEGLQPAEGVKEILDGCDRRKAGVMVPAHGLYLNKINYPEHFCFGKRRDFFLTCFEKA